MTCVWGRGIVTNSQNTLNVEHLLVRHVLRAAVRLHDTRLHVHICIWTEYNRAQMLSTAAQEQYTSWVTFG